MGLKLCIFDLDDTLIDTGPLYEAARSAAATLIGSLVDLPPEQVAETIRTIDVGRSSVHGASRNRFSQSLVLAYKTLCISRNCEYSVSARDELISIGMSVFSRRSPVLHGVAGVLDEVVKRVPVCVLTRGDKEVQMRRVIDSGLANHFDNVFVVDRKTPNVFAAICRFYDVQPEDAIMVGDSWIRDIQPALESGLSALFLQKGTYQLEGGSNSVPAAYPKLTISTDVQEILALLEAPNE